ncbi:DsbA family protein [Nocardioides insulae]|uniref:DsbA family protein n=1 Tax=Nocardioides insulae TaxID=394734 RepID=UPI00041EBC45|nr:thioredoxin domain-containing protein [Nocardioides insulae]
MSKKSDARAAKAAAALKEQQRRERRRNLSVAAIVVVVLIAIIGAVYLSTSIGGDDEVDAKAATGEHALVIGPETAPHTMVIYEDFLCPYCGELERSSHEEFSQLAEDGKVRIEYRPFNLLTDFDYSMDALEVFGAVMLTADADVAAAFHTQLFEDQPSESASSFPSTDDLVDEAVDAGADRDAVEDALDSDQAMDWAKAATEEAADAGVQGTPTVLLDGEQFTDFRTIDEMVTNLVDAVK